MAAVAEDRRTEQTSKAGSMRGLMDKFYQLKVPLSGSLELTKRCNLRCVHCYIPEHRKTSGQEMDTARMLSVLDQITDAGCLYLLITGGEPLIRADFAELYTRAKTNGMFVTVFTNGTTITSEIVNLFKDLPPHTVEITLYGATAPTYERVTQVPGSFERCLSGIRALTAAGFNLKLKTMLMSYNSHELKAMQDIATGFGLKFRYDSGIVPRLDGDMSPTQLRLTPKEAVDVEVSDPERLEALRAYFNKSSSHLPIAEPGASIFQCGAGIRSFHVDSGGLLQPCMMEDTLSYDLKEGDFLTGWQDVLPTVRDKKASKDFRCSDCEKKSLCGYCPPFFRLEGGSEETCSEYVCDVGTRRFLAIKDKREG